jgi:UDP-N-acetylmuramate dehydrogenase
LTEEVKGLLKRLVRGKLAFGESMTLHTSLKVGGNADCFAAPADQADLESLMRILDHHGIRHTVIGGGFNLLVRDGGVRGVVISLEKLAQLQSKNDCIEAGAGVENRVLVDFARMKGLGGIEFLAGIPGRLGGAIAMNAGAAGETVTDCLEYVVTLKDGRKRVTAKKDLRYGYRFLRLDEGEIILGATFRLKASTPDAVAARIAILLENRRRSQQVGFPNAGSFFKNPAQEPAWRLIEKAGLRGFRIGGAQVSEVHANFLVNVGEATAADFLALAEHVKEEVRKRSGICLREEVRIIGDDGNGT